MSGLAQEIALAKWVAGGLRRIGQISIAVGKDGAFSLAHREDAARNDLTPYARTEDAASARRPTSPRRPMRIQASGCASPFAATVAAELDVDAPILCAWGGEAVMQRAAARVLLRELAASKAGQGTRIAL